MRAGGRVAELGGLTCMAGTDPTPFIVNTAMRSGPIADAGAALDRAIDFYASIGHGFLLITSQDDTDLESAATSSGWQRVLELPVMIRTERVAEASLPDEVALRAADPLRDLIGFRDLMVGAFGSRDPEAGAIRSAFARADALAAPGVAAFIASVEGINAAAALVYVVDGTGIVAWVATHADYRRRGLGAAVTRAATNAGFHLGATLLALQASHLGRPVYAALGYATISTDRLWFQR